MSKPIEKTFGVLNPVFQGAAGFICDKLPWE